SSASRQSSALSATSRPSPTTKPRARTTPAGRTTAASAGATAAGSKPSTQPRNCSRIHHANPTPQHGHNAAEPAAKASRRSSGAPKRSATGQGTASTPAGALSNSTSTDEPAPNS